MRLGILISVLAVALTGTTRGAVTLSMRTVFKGQDRFEQLGLRAKAENWKTLPIGERTAAVGQAMAQGLSGAFAPQQPPAAQAAPAQAAPESIEDRLGKLKGLLDKGLISQADYDSTKAELLKKLLG